MTRALASAAMAAGLALTVKAQDTALSPQRGLSPAPIQGAETSATSRPGDMTTREAHEMARSGSATLIDVRSPFEWRTTGIAEGATGITLQDRDFLDQVLSAVGGDKTRPVALICQSGNRSLVAQRQLQAAGFETVYNVTGGTLDWQAQGLPTEDCRRC